MADDSASEGPSVLDPAMTLGQDDPLRSWADANIDWRTGKLMSQNPQAAIQSMIDRGIPPPDVHADPADPSRALGYADATASSDPAAAGGGVDSPIVRTNPNGTITGNITNPAAAIPAPVTPNPNAVGLPSVPLPGGIPLPAPRPAAADGSALDPEENLSPVAPGTVPLPTPKPGDTDVSARKKEDVGGALGDFSKSLSGVKALQPPPVNPVGTPSVRGTSAISAPDISKLIALTGNSVPPPTLAALGRLLVAGKA